jgi:predicted nuclease of predicted toxin-antitoxin system
VKIKLDENLPAGLAVILGSLGHDVDTVPQQGLRGMVDSAVWKAAQATDRFLITQDLDFSDIRRYAPGTHHGLLLIRLRVPGRRALTERVRALFAQKRVEDWKGCLVVATDVKLRIRTPQGRQ